MSQKDPNVVMSDLSGNVTKDGVTVDVNIIRLEDDMLWSLEIVNNEGASVVWDEKFTSDVLAYAEFEQIILDEGIKVFFDRSNDIPFRR